jgi:hypothetical protein
LSKFFFLASEALADNKSMIVNKFRAFGFNKKSFYYDVFIHATLSSLRDEWDKLPKNATPHGSNGVNAYTLKYFPPEKKCLGEIHLTKNSPEDIISHECCHAALHYISNKKYPAGLDLEEEFCYNQQYFFKNIKNKLRVN